MDITVFRVWLRASLVIIAFLAFVYIFLSRIPSDNVSYTWPWGAFIGSNTLLIASAAALRIVALVFVSLCVALNLHFSNFQRLAELLRLHKAPRTIIETAYMFAARAFHSWGESELGYRTRVINQKSLYAPLTIRQKLQIIGPYIVTLILQARIISDTLETRGWHEGMHYRRVHVQNWSLFDVLILLVSGLTLYSAYAWESTNFLILRQNFCFFV